MRPARLGVDLPAALHLVGRFLKYFALTFAFPTVLAAGYGEPVWPFLAAAGITVAAGGRAPVRLPDGPHDRDPRGVPRGDADLGARGVGVRAPVPLRRAAAAQPDRRVLRGHVRDDHDRCERAHRYPGAEPVDGDVAPVLAMARRDGHRGARARDPAAPPSGRATAHGERDARPRVRAAHDSHPGHRAPLLARLRRVDRADGADPRLLRVDRRRPVDERVPGGRARLLDPADRGLLAAGSLDRALRARQPVGDGALHGARRRQLRAALPGAHAPGEPVPGRGVPLLSRPARPRQPPALPRAIACRHLRVRGGGDPPGDGAGRLDDDHHGLRERRLRAVEQPHLGHPHAA